MGKTTHARALDVQEHSQAKPPAPPRTNHVFAVVGQPVPPAANSRADASSPIRTAMSENETNNDTIAFRAKPVFGMAIPDRRRLKKSRTNGYQPQLALFANDTAKRARRAAVPPLPSEDNTPEGLRALLAANAHYREVRWPEPY